MKITDMSRGHLRLEDGKRFTIIDAEMLSVDRGTRMGFAIYPALIEAWETPTGRTPIDERGRAEILRFLREEFARRDRHLDLVPSPGWQPEPPT